MRRQEDAGREKSGPTLNFKPVQNKDISVCVTDKVQRRLSTSPQDDAAVTWLFEV